MFSFHLTIVSIFGVNLIFFPRGLRPNVTSNELCPYTRNEMVTRDRVLHNCLDYGWYVLMLRKPSKNKLSVENQKKLEICIKGFSRTATIQPDRFLSISRQLQRLQFSTWWFLVENWQSKIAGYGIMLAPRWLPLRTYSSYQSQTSLLYTCKKYVSWTD